MSIFAPGLVVPIPTLPDLCDAHVFGEIAVAIVVAVLNVECERIVRAVDWFFREGRGADQFIVAMER